MQHMPKILIAFLLLLISLVLGTLAMDNSKVDHFTIRFPSDSAFKPSNANKPNPNLPNLSVHGKELEGKFASDLQRNPRIQKHIGGERVASSWWEHIHAENDRNYHHMYMNDYADDIKALKDRRESTSGKESPRSHIVTKTEKELYKKYERSKQDRDKYREKMRDIRKDAYIHKEAGNFNDKDVHYVTQMFHDDSASLGYLSDGRHVSSPRIPKLSKSRSANFSSEPSSSPKLARSRSVKA